MDGAFNNAGTEKSALKHIIYVKDNLSVNPEYEHISLLWDGNVDGFSSPT